MSLNPEVLEFDSLLPAEDSLLFKEPVPISQDAFSSLDLPDFSNFAVEDVDFGDLEFLDLASVPHDKTKKSSSSATGPYFNSLATPSGYCSTNYLTVSYPFPAPDLMIIQVSILSSDQMFLGGGEQTERAAL